MSQRIIFWNDGFHPRIGGIETLCMAQCKALVERGYHVVVFTGKDKADWLDEEMIHGIQLYRLPFIEVVDQRNLLSLRAIKNKVMDCIQSFRPDIIHLQDTCNRGSLVFHLIRSVFTQPIVITNHGINMFDFKIQDTFLSALKVASHMIYVSAFVKDSFRKHVPDLSIPESIILNSLPIPDDSPTEQSKPFTVRFIGRFSIEKGLLIALKAFELFAEKYPDVQLEFIGDGPLRQSLQSKIDRSAFRSRIRLLGRMRFDEVHPYYASADCIVMPSIKEGFGLVALQAAQAKTPVLASNDGGLCEIVHHEKTGFLLPIGDSTAFAQAMEWLYLHPREKVEMGEAAFHRVQQYFDFDQSISQLTTVYQHV